MEGQSGLVPIRHDGEVDVVPIAEVVKEGRYETK